MKLGLKPIAKNCCIVMAIKVDIDYLLYDLDDASSIKHSIENLHF